MSTLRLHYHKLCSGVNAIEANVCSGIDMLLDLDSPSIKMQIAMQLKVVSAKCYLPGD